MNLRRKKKGFTIVELVIVIAVIGVLAAILIPTFVGLVNRANKSSDTRLVRDLNNALAIDSATNGKHATMTDALAVTDEYGFNVQRINAKASNSKILWDSEHDVFCYLNSDGKIEYVPASVKAGEELAEDDYRLWIISNEVNTVYSTYLYGYTGNGVIETSKGLDVGETTTVTSVTYNGGTTAQNVVIRTNGGMLTVNAPADTVKHYGDAQVVTLTAVGTSSYYEHGSVNLVDIKKGRLVITNDTEAEVGTIYLTATNDAYDEIILATQSGSELPELVARENVSIPTTGEKLVVTIQTNVNANGENPTKTEEIKLYPASDVKEATNGYNVSDLGLLVVEAISSDAQTEAASQISDATVLASVKETNVTTKEEVVAAATEFAGGKGTELDPWLIENAQHIRNIGNHSNDDINHYWKVKDGITEIDCNDWVSVDIKGDFDGNNVTINNLSATLFGTVKSESSKSNTIKNLKINAQVILDDWNSVVVYYNAAKNTTYENIVVHGYLEGATGVATYIQFGSNGAIINFKDCESDLTIVATSGCACGFIAHPYGATSVNLINSHYTGNMATVYSQYNNNCYVNGNYFTGVTFDESSQRSDVQWDGGYNGHYHYLAEGKTSNLTTKTGSLPENKGDIIVTSAESGASRAVISIIISPNDINETGCYTQTFKTEAAINNGSFSSEDIKYFNVRVNPEGVTESGIHGDNYDIVGDRWGHTLGGNTFVKVTQYDTLGNVICVTTYNFNDAN